MPEKLEIGYNYSFGFIVQSLGECHKNVGLLEVLIGVGNSNCSILFKPPQNSKTRHFIGRRSEKITGRYGGYRYLVSLISRLAYERGYGAVIEEQTKDGGWVDVALTSNDKRIACEISISTPNDHEVRNIRKCLGDGYNIVLAVVQTKRAVRAFQKHLSENLNDDEMLKVQVVEPVGLLSALEEHKPKEHKKVRGYRVEVGYAASSDEDMERRANAIAKIIAKSMRGS